MKIAVVGSGISGLSAAWILSRNHEVHLFEAGPRLGGHACTVQADNQPMDIGFLVYNELTYPRLTKMFRTLGVETVESDMSLSIQAKHKMLEWNGTNLNTLFGQRINIIRPSFYKILFEIIKFHKNAEIYLEESKKNSWTLRNLFEVKRYSDSFCSDYMIPMGAAIWSTPEDKILDFPASSFLNFCFNHRLLQVNDRPVWRTVKNGSQEYVKKISQSIQHIFLNSSVHKIERRDGSIFLFTQGKSAKYDKVVMTTHAPVTLDLIQDKSLREIELLSTFKYQKNDIVLHNEDTVMPTSKQCWASWNVQASQKNNSSPQVELSYYLNRLQPWIKNENYFATLNAKSNLKNPLFIEKFEHPLFDEFAIRSQEQLKEIQGIGGIYYAGSWTGYGFHEDGIKSAIEVCKMLGSEPPWGVS
jgi:predicted NAD/FAD-binding protein